MPGSPEVLVIFLLTVFMFGPDKLPEFSGRVWTALQKWFKGNS